MLRGIALSHRLADKEADEIEDHIHADAHFILVTGGTYVTAARRTAVKAGALIFNPVGTNHRDRFEPGLGSFFAISIAPNEAVELCRALPSEPREITSRAAAGMAAGLMRETVRRGPALRLESLCLELLGRIAENDDTARGVPDWLLRAREWIEDCYADELELRAMARAIGIHPVHLARGFRRHFCCTAAEFLLQRRLQAAAQMLVTGRLPLSEIALAAGFADQSHFTRRFADGYGITPGVYRRHLRRR